MGVIGIAINGAQAAARKIQKLGADLLEVERRAVDRAGRIMRSRSVNMVSGDVLKVRSGALRASINKGDPFLDADRRGYAVRVGVLRGAAEKYAPVHEFGGTFRRVSRLTVRQGPGKPYTVTYRARRYIGIPFDEIRPQVPLILQQELQAAIARAATGA